MSDYLTRLLARNQPGPLQPAPDLPVGDESQELTDPFAEEPATAAPVVQPSTFARVEAARAAPFLAAQPAPALGESVQRQPAAYAPPAPLSATLQSAPIEAGAPHASAPANINAPPVAVTEISPQPPTTSETSVVPPSLHHGHVTAPVSHAPVKLTFPAPAEQAEEAVDRTATPPETVAPSASSAVNLGATSLDAGGELQKLLRWLQHEPAGGDEPRPAPAGGDEQKPQMARSSAPLPQALAPAQAAAGALSVSVHPRLSIGRLVVEVTPPPPAPARPQPVARPAPAPRTTTDVTSKLRFGMGQL